MCDRDHTPKVLVMLVAVLAVLLAAYWLPEIKFAGVSMRQVDIAGDLLGKSAGISSKSQKEEQLASIDTPNSSEPDDTVATQSEIVTNPEPVKETKSATTQDGITPILDYSNDNRGMQPFYNALKNKNGPVKVAVLGDSYIEGDIITAHLREMLQDQYGGCGVGFVGMSSNISGFRNSVKHTFGNWEYLSDIVSAGYKKQYAIISGEQFIPDSASWVELSGTKRYYAHLDACEQSSVYFISHAENEVTAYVNGDDMGQTFDVTASDEIQKLTVDGKINKIKWFIERGGEDYMFYGATMDSRSGVIVDNFPVRGAAGINLYNIEPGMISGFQAVRPYDLVILVYGLNVAQADCTDYEYYKIGMLRTISKLKENMPRAGFLLLSVGDRAQRVDGELSTMPGVISLVGYQHEIAKKSGIAFWNTFEAMGGEGSIVEMAKSSPAQANTDYTHLTHQGGKKVAAELFKAIQQGVKYSR